MKEYLAGLAIIVAVVMMVSAKNAIECHAKWDDAAYSVFTGCMVNTHDGYIPEKNVVIIHWINNEDETE